MKKLISSLEAESRLQEKTIGNLQKEINSAIDSKKKIQDKLQESQTKCQEKTNEILKLKEELACLTQRVEKAEKSFSEASITVTNLRASLENSETSNLKLQSEINASVLIRTELEQLRKEN